MQNVPKIVRERLQAATPAATHSSANLPSANHPDADALTAFAERSLPERERTVVLEHLARCGDCRDIMALALPATEPVGVATRAPARGWLTWPVLRWGLVAAGIVALASLGIVQYQKRSENIASKSSPRLEVAANQAAGQNKAPNQTKDQSPASPVSSGMAKKVDNLQPPPPSAFTGSVDVNDSTIYDKKSTSRAMGPRIPAPQPQAESARGKALVVGGALPHGPMLANQLQQQNTGQNQAPIPAATSPFAKQQAAGDLTATMNVPAASETVEVESQSAQFETKGRNANALKDLPAAPPPQNEEYGSARIGKAKPAVTAQVGSAGSLSSTAATAAPGPSQATDALTLASSAPVPRWTINSAGTLQRSFDQGFTWQAVDVNANPGYLQIAGKASQEKSKEASQAFKREEATPIFRAVAATGADVWAGGSRGALYHSLDAGNHWTHVTPTSSGTMLTGDIVSLEFPDTQHGKVSTSTGEVWMTRDAGQTWQKQ
jgi:Photosynthesis system II assembly factor YCF48/Putative zinc-finger